jgi:predicted nucleotide-binding protein
LINLEDGVTTKPKVFIGCSVPGLKVAGALQVLLDHSAECQIWNQGLMRLSTTTLESLLAALQDSEFAIFVLTADDKTEQRDKFGMTPRDNVIFELGLFLGRLGPGRTFMVRPRGVDLLLPTDLLGVEPADYDDPGDPKKLLPALGSAAYRINLAIDQAQSAGPSR